jgi:hypothetical protein
MVSRLLARPVRLARTAAAWTSGQIRRQFITRNRRMAAVLTVATVGIGVATVHLSEWWFSPGMLILPVLAGGLLLWPRALRILFGLVALTLLYDALYRRAGAGIIATVVITGVFADVLARTRWKLGVQGLRGDRMLIELRDRLRAQGRMPPLPTGWRSAAVLRPAGGASFGGDFLVSACDGKTLEVALVDVSGKGVDAGTRALLLSGAFGGLLGSVPRGEFLTACNAYLRRGPVTEGFVTAVHLALDLTTGDYVLTSAGHPPPAQFDAGSGTWKVTQARGIVLGVVPDALMLYTDGLVEAPGRDIDAGTDRLLGEATRLVASSFQDAAAELVRVVKAGGAGSDDCALVMIWRA